MVLDPSSFSQPDECVVENINLDLAVNFEEKVISGTVHLTVKKKTAEAKILVLDTNELKIACVREATTGQELQFTLGDHTKAFGSKLEIHLPLEAQQLTVSVEYRTSPTCSALQWLAPEQTAGKRQPFLFSHCQAIHARSLYPCQDTPSVKFTYTAQVKAPREVTILMSATPLGADLCAGDSSCKTHHFEQKVPIPSYLMAIVGGDLECRIIGPRSKVWAERELVDRAAFEFSETEQMLQTAESLLGPYEWGRYDLLVLPPSYPFGGMENPCLTFISPTLLAGDRSLACLVAHEIAHSWIGNLVTNSNHQHFWLNEGHAEYLERRIAAKLGEGKPLFHFMAKEGWEVLKESVRKLQEHGESAFTKLIPDLTGVDPDDVFSGVPYEKGFALLFFLENLLGGPDKFEPFVKAFIESFKFQSIDSEQWKDFLFSYFSSQEDQAKLNSVDWDMWFYAEGMPDIQPQFDTSLMAPCEALNGRWQAAGEDDLGAFSADDQRDWTALQRREFVSLLLQWPASISVDKLQAMDRLYRLTDAANTEIQFRWLRLGIKARWPAIIPGAIKFVTEQGRLKFVRLLYRDLYEWQGARPVAVDNFLKHRSEMHSTTAKEVARDLDVHLAVAVGTGNVTFS